MLMNKYYYFKENKILNFKENNLLSIMDNKKILTIEIENETVYNFLKSNYNKDKFLIINKNNLSSNLIEVVNYLENKDILKKISKKTYEHLKENSPTNRTQYYFLNTSENNLKTYTDTKFNYLQNKHIMIIGLGAVGSEILRQLLAINIKNFTLIDYDTVDITNLNRQFYFNINDIGKNKLEVIKNKITYEYNNLKINIFNKKINSEKDLFEIINALPKIDFIICSADTPILEIKKIILNISIKFKLPTIFCGLSVDNGTIGPLLTTTSKKNKYLNKLNKLLNSANFKNINICKSSFGVTNSIISNFVSYDIIMYLMNYKKQIKTLNNILMFDFNSFKIDRLLEI